MRRSEEEVLLYALAAYLGASLLATVLILLGSLAGMKLIFVLARFVFGTPEVYWLKPVLFDSAGFALASAATALCQFFLAGLLRLFAEDRPFLCAVSAFCALFCGLLFWRGALLTPLGNYGFSGLVVTLSALLGSFQAVLQRASENPWRPLAGRFGR